MPRRTYLNDFITLSALPAGCAPGDSFRRLKMPSLFFMSLALGAEAEKGVRQPDTLGPCTFRVETLWAGAGGTYSFIVCRLCRFPLRVRYMPRSISAGPPRTSGPPLPGKLCREHRWAPAFRPGVPDSWRATMVQAAAVSAPWNPRLTTGHPGIGWDGTQTGGARKWAGPGRGAGKRDLRPAQRGSP